ncbi:MAG TPA: hypothetical protein VKA15_19360 [Isosphaeraceae bacterium]|nr:hypothetical protein [Isosphaeraceae bacterium]
MSSADELAGNDVSRDPYFTAAVVDPGKPSGPRVGESERRSRQFRTRTMMMAVVLAAVWLGVLLDPQVDPLVAFLLGGFGVTLAVMGAAMGLGLLGFGLFAAVDRLLGVFRRASRWPDE